MSESLNQAMWPNRSLLTATGVWPLPQDASNAQKIFAYCRIVLSLLCISFTTWPLIYTIIVNWGDIDVLASLGSAAIMFTLSAFKLVYVIVRRRSCQRVYQYLTEFSKNTENQEDQRIYQKFTKSARKMTIITLIWASIEIVLFASNPIIVALIKFQGSNETFRTESLPLQISYGFDYDRPMIFEALYFCQTFGTTVTVTAMIGCDCTFTSAVIHLAAQFRLIRSRLQEIGERISRNEIILSEEIGLCVAHHQRALKITHEISNLVSPVFFGQIATSGYVLCLCGYVLVTSDPISVDVLKFYFLFAYIVIQLGVWCWPGELIVRESGAIACTIYYEVPWLKLPKSFRRDLNFVAMRAQKECRIVALFQVMSVRKLTEVFNKAGSYMALLHSIRN